MKTKYLLLPLLVRAALGADAGCPVTISKVKRDSGLCDRITYCFSFDASNASGKPISALQVHGAAVDSKHRVHPLQYDYAVNDIASGQTRNVSFSSHRLLGGDYQGIKLWVNHIQFADNTTWDDGGNRSCGGQDVKGNVKGK